MAEFLGNQLADESSYARRRRPHWRVVLNDMQEHTGRVWLCLLLTGALAQSSVVRAADFSVATPNAQFNFQINGVNGNPTITLARGRTYTFALNTTANFHPFAIGTDVFGPAPAGVSGNNGGSSGTITYAVPADAVNCVYYCTIHGAALSGSIVMVDPPVLPVIRIVDFTVGTDLTLTSTVASTNGLTFVPEFSTDLLATNWFALTVQTNRFFNGTNEAICGRPPGNQIFVRIRAQQN